MRILALREKFEHMSVHSGYDALYHYLPEGVAVDSVFCNFKKRYPRGLGRVLSTASKYISTSPFYNAQSVEAELRLLSRALTKKYNIVHYTFGEPYYGLAGKLKKTSGPAVVITNHQPVSWWQKNEILIKNYSKSNALIALSEYDRDYFQSHFTGEVCCIPHGIDTAFYKPAPVGKRPDNIFRVIFAGRYLRDMPVLAEVVKKTATLLPEIQFDIVYIPKKEVNEPYLTEILDYATVSWHADISDESFLSLYQQADCCLIPLKDSTANNAILEAMACGLPVISTDLPAVKTYLDNSMSILGRFGNADDLCEALILLFNNLALRKSMAVNARKRVVENFDWHIIAGKTMDLFKSLQ